MREATGVGADFAFETAGRASLVSVGLAATRNGGTVVCVGAPPIGEKIEIAPAALFTVTEKKLLGCILGSSNSLREIPRLVALWRAGRLDLEALITARRPLARDRRSDGRPARRARHPHRALTLRAPLAVRRAFACTRPHAQEQLRIDLVLDVHEAPVVVLAVEAAGGGVVGVLVPVRADHEGAGEHASPCTCS